MKNVTQKRPRRSADLRTNWSWQVLASDDELFGSLEQSFNLRCTPRIREFIARALATFAWQQAPSPTREQYSAARTKLVQETVNFLKLLEQFRTSTDGAEQWAIGRLIFAIGEPAHGYGAEGPPTTVPRSQLEARLSDAVLNLELERRGRGRPKLDREGIFCALYVGFEAAGGHPTANYQDTTGLIDSRFVRFVRKILEACPQEVKLALGTGIASAVREQLREWRKSPGTRGGPNHQLGRQQYKYLVAGQNNHQPTANWSAP